MGIKVNGDRLWESLMQMAQIGATAKGGVCRLALTDLDKEGRDLLTKWCSAEGCGRQVDPMGNLFFRRPGKSADGRPVGAGSHLDSQPTGGKFDGVYGVLAALEVIRTLMIVAPKLSCLSNWWSGRMRRALDFRCDDRLSNLCRRI